MPQVITCISRRRHPNPTLRPALVAMSLAGRVLCLALCCDPGHPVGTRPLSKQQPCQPGLWTGCMLLVAGVFRLLNGRAVVDMRCRGAQVRAFPGMLQPEKRGADMAKGAAGARGAHAGGVGLGRGLGCPASERCSLSAVNKVIGLVRMSSRLVARCVRICVCRAECRARQGHRCPQRWWHRARTMTLRLAWMCVALPSAHACCALCCESHARPCRSRPLPTVLVCRWRTSALYSLP